MDLFDYMGAQNREKESPLASRLRPETLDEVVGQQHIIGKDKLLYRAIKADKIRSGHLLRAAGTGKTTLARVIANTTSASFTQINATSAGKKDMGSRGGAGEAAAGDVWPADDPLHRRDPPLQPRGAGLSAPYVEDGTIILIGATTENPYFEVNGALLSRSVIFELKPLGRETSKL